MIKQTVLPTGQVVTFTEHSIIAISTHRLAIETVAATTPAVQRICDVLGLANEEALCRFLNYFEGQGTANGYPKFVDGLLQLQDLYFDVMAYTWQCDYPDALQRRRLLRRCDEWAERFITHKNQHAAGMYLIEGIVYATGTDSEPDMAEHSMGIAIRDAAIDLCRVHGVMRVDSGDTPSWCLSPLTENGNGEQAIYGIMELLVQGCHAIHQAIDARDEERHAHAVAQQQLLETIAAEQLADEAWLADHGTIDRPMDDENDTAAGGLFA